MILLLAVILAYRSKRTLLYEWCTLAHFQGLYQMRTDETQDIRLQSNSLWHHTHVAVQYNLHAHKGYVHSGQSQRGTEAHGCWVGTGTGTR